MTYCKIYLKPKKEESVLRFHPWIFSGAIAHIEEKPSELATDRYRPQSFDELIVKHPRDL